VSTRENGGANLSVSQNLMHAGCGDRVAFSARRFCDVSLFGSLYSLMHFYKFKLRSFRPLPACIKRGGARARAPRGSVSRQRDTGPNNSALWEELPRSVMTDPLLLRREKHTPVQTVVCQVGTKEGGQGPVGSDDIGRV